MKTLRSNNQTKRYYIFFTILFYGQYLLCQSSSKDALSQIINNLSEGSPEKNDVFITQYKAGQYDQFSCLDRGKILHQLGLGLYYQNREKEAILLFEEALHKAWQNCSEVSALEYANTSFNIGVCYQYTEEANKGKPYIEQAMRVFVTDKNYPRADLCYKYQGAANFFSTLKDFTKAELYYKAAEKLASHLTTEDQFHLHNEIFVLYLTFGEWAKAQEKAAFLTNFVNSNTQYIDPLSQSILHLNKAELCLKSGHAEKVPEECHAALRLLPKEEAEFISNAHEILGVYYLENKNYAQSKSHYEIAYRLRSMSQNIVQANLAKAFSIENLAEIALQTNEVQRSIDLINEAITLLASPCGLDGEGNPILKNCLTANGIHLLRQLMLKQKIYLKAGMSKAEYLKRANALSTKMDSLSTMVLEQAYLDESKLYLLDQLNNKTEMQLNASLALYQKTKNAGDLEACANYVSASKSFVLRQYLDQNKLLYLKKENSNFGNVLALREKLSKLRSTIETSGNKDDSLYAQANELMAALETAEKNAGLGNTQDNTKNKPLIRSLSELPADICIIETFCSSDRVHFFIYRKSGLKHRIFERKQIEGWVDKLKLSLVNPSQAYDKANASKLWLQCFAPVIKSEITNLLVFIPDGFFHGLPIEALVDEKGAYIVESLKIQYGHSSQMLLNDEHNYDYHQELTGFATTYSSKLNARLGLIPYFKGLQLNPLHNAVKELESGSEDFSSKLFTQNEASPLAFKKYGPGSKILYFSLHGIANEENGSLSALIFDDQNNDFVLHSYEINAIPLNAQLVVLSSCQSATGRVFSAEGIQGLTRSFLLAGCHQVISSFWNASEKSASFILNDFMELVAAGESSVTALSKAKRNYLANASPSQKHPYFWAGFILTGGLDAAPTSKILLIPIILFILAAMVVSIWVIKKRKKIKN